MPQLSFPWNEGQPSSQTRENGRTGARKNYTLEALGLVENGEDTCLSNIAYLAAQILNAPVSLVSVIHLEKDLHYISAGCGLPLANESERQLSFDDSICKIVFDDRKPLLVIDLLADDRTKNMQSVRQLGLLSYIGVPIHSVSGQVIGTLCCLKKETCDWDQSSLESLKRLAFTVDDIIRSRARALDEEATNTKLRNLLKARSSFTSHLSHEIRTPLTGMVGSIKLLNALDLTGKAGELIHVLNRSSMRLLEVVNDTLDIAKLDAGKFEFNEEPCDLGELARNVVSMFSATAADKGIYVEVADRLQGKTFKADKKVLETIFHNLFSNAIKFTEAGSAVIALTENAYGSVQISVVDTGIGIAPEAHESIFEEFQQANPSVARKYGGTGLGMAIVKRLVEAMQGEIELKSAPGKGTTFKLLLPLDLLSLADNMNSAPSVSETHTPE